MQTTIEPRHRLEAPARADRVRLCQERDLYLRLLGLGAEQEIEPLLEQVLALSVELTGARQGYLELWGAEREESQPAFWIGHDCSGDDVDAIRSAISRGIIAEALATGETVATTCAMHDPRFRRRDSVQLQRIQAVLCAPIGGDPSLGVVYLRGCDGAGPFPPEARERVELFARHVAPLVDLLLLRRRRRAGVDPTQGVREQLRLAGIVGRSPALASALQQAALVAPLDVHVLLTGESGTGKSQLARVIHENGPRAGQPFVEVNCAALPERLLENELFGCEPGAHSTAQRAVSGKLAAAEHGTLLLDEVAELSITAQAKVLQLLQSRIYYPLGGFEPVRADVRVIAATNVDLEEAVRERRFREDLFYRLQVLPIRLPALAERREDVAELARHLCGGASERHGLPRLEISPNTLRAIEMAEWPGNVRQLGHALEAAVIRACGEAARRLERHHVFPDTERSMEHSNQYLTFQEATRCFQRELLLRTLDQTGWNVAETARRLDLARSHVYNLIRAFGFQRANGTASPEA